ncbi:hypothetical protein PROPEN_02497 [Proteus penneri ATCC 35198]|nr:hypothetical protein PROPEN_02497 [Proteus penneri ATCC 35198]
MKRERGFFFFDKKIKCNRYRDFLSDDLTKWYGNAFSSLNIKN